MERLQLVEEIPAGLGLRLVVCHVERPRLFELRVPQAPVAVLLDFSGGVARPDGLIVRVAGVIREEVAEALVLRLH